MRADAELLQGELAREPPRPAKDGVPRLSAVRKKKARQKAHGRPKDVLRNAARRIRREGAFRRAVRHQNERRHPVRVLPRRRTERGERLLPHGGLHQKVKHGRRRIGRKGLFQEKRRPLCPVVQPDALIKLQNGHTRPPSAARFAAATAPSIASAVRARSSPEWAKETNIASNCEGATKIPAESIF